jgi:hypothetical protein
VPRTFLAKKTPNGLSLAIWDYAACMIPDSIRLKFRNTDFLEVVAISFASFLADSSNIVCIIFADNRSQYNHSITISMNSPGIIHGASVRARMAAFGLIGICMVIMVYGCKRGLK